MDIIAKGWLAASDDAVRHYYSIEPDQVSGNSLCGQGLGWSRNWVLRYASSNHNRADNCQRCNRKRLKIQGDGQVN